MGLSKLVLCFKIEERSIQIVLSTYIARIQQIDQYPALLDENNHIGYSLGSKKYHNYNKIPLNWIRNIEKEVGKVQEEMDTKLCFKI